MLDRLTIERMAATAGDTPILIALSGGGDSVALMHLLVAHFGAATLRAAIVDHALRPGSADDARRAQGFAAELDLVADILALSWPEAANRAQQAAREARYAALCDHARSVGARVIAAAHTADDQAETVLMRAAAGSTWRGLAGIAPLAPAPLWPEGRGVSVARPLLGARRESLRAFLRQRGASWIDDPANTNPAFARVRIRARLADLESAGFDPMRLARLAAALRAHAATQDAAAAALIARAARFGEGTIVLARSRWEGGGEVRRRALAALIAAAAGAAREPAPAALAELQRRLEDDSFSAATLGGARISRRGGEIVFERDRGAVAGRADGAAGLAPLALAADTEAVWDGRLAVTAAQAGVVVVAEGAAPRFLRHGADAEHLLAGRRWLLSERAAHAIGASPAGASGVP